MSDFEQLVERVRKIDSDAADYLEGDEIRNTDGGMSECGDLYGVMMWDATPHGFSYWHNIATQLTEG